MSSPDATLSEINFIMRFKSETWKKKCCSLQHQHSDILGSNVNIPAACKLRTAFRFPCHEISDTYM